MRHEIFTAAWWKAASIRAIRTVAECAAGALTGATAFGGVDWFSIAFSGVMAGVLSMLTSLAGLPEVEPGAVFAGRWWLATGIRTLKTFCQTLASVLAPAVTAGAINWAQALSAAGVAAVITIFICFAGIPECPETDNEEQAG